MITQTLHNPLMICNLVTATALDDPSKQPVLASSRDYGFDFDEDQFAALLANRSAQPMPEVTVNEFESRYTWFIS